MSEPSASPSTVGNEVGPQCPPLFCSKRLALQAPHAQGWCLSPTVELSKIDGTRSRRAAPLFQYDTKPGGPFLQIKHFLPTPAAQPLTVLSCGWEHSTPVTPGMPAGWPAAAMHALVASNRLDFSQSFHKLSPLPQICRS